MLSFSSGINSSPISKMNDRRKRSAAFLVSEKLLLLDIIEKHFNIIENKRTDSISNKVKKSEWDVVSFEFNASNTALPNRTAESLKTLWENLKKSAKASFIKTSNGTYAHLKMWIKFLQNQVFSSQC